MSQILGVQFASASAEELVEQALKGGLVVVPSGPGLAVDLLKSHDYRTAVTEADIAVADSGAMVLFMKLFHRKRVQRVSGLQFLQVLLSQEALKAAGSAFWVHPTEAQMETNIYCLEDNGFRSGKSDNYVAPFYPSADIEDFTLLEQLKEREPKAIILCVGGGVQERLGYWIREQYKQAELPCPAIICTGAAIGFLSGNQVHIPKWADRCYLGWFFRCISDPKTFIPRYWSAVPLAYYIIRYGEKLPPLKA
jgi:exopolysaccharide biosynthesis WecB/TagA/CpsF family protein